MGKEMQGFFNYLKTQNIVDGNSQNPIFSRINIFGNFLLEQSAVMNLISDPSMAKIVEDHMLDSVKVLEYYNFSDGATCCDIGTGAGFPGLILAIVKPSVKFTLVEATAKKTNFLKAVVLELDLKNVTIVNDRCETWVREHTEEFDYVLARAVASVKVVSELSVRMLRLGGRLILWKGPKLPLEIEDSRNFCTLLGLRQGGMHRYQIPNFSSRWYFELNKITKTPKEYPRSYNKIKKAL